MPRDYTSAPLPPNPTAGVSSMNSSMGNSMGSDWSANIPAVSPLIKRNYSSAPIPETLLPKISSQVETPDIWKMPETSEVKIPEQVNDYSDRTMFSSAPKFKPSSIGPQVGKPNVIMPKAPMSAREMVDTGIESAAMTGIGALDVATKALFEAPTQELRDAEEAIIQDMGKKGGEIGGGIGEDLSKLGGELTVRGATSPAGLASLIPYVGAIPKTAQLTSRAAKAGLGKAFPRLAAKYANKMHGPITMEQAFIKELADAKKLRVVTDRSRSPEIGRRLDEFTKELKAGGGGEGAFQIALRKMKGSLPLPSEYEFKSIRNKFTDENINDLYKKVTDSNLLSKGDRLTAMHGMDKVLAGEYGGVPQSAEIGHLNKVFGSELGEALGKNKGLIRTIADSTSAVRTINSSNDISFNLRQNIGNISRPTFWKNLVSDQRRALTEKGAKEVAEEITKYPHYELAMRSGVDLGDFHEENFANEWARKYYPGVDVSERLFNAGAKGQRMRLFNELVDKIQAGGGMFKNTQIPLTGDWFKHEPINFYEEGNSRIARELAKFVNISTGRGTLNTGVVDLSRSAKIINNLLFSPRLATSRMQMFTKMLDPNVPGYIKKEYARNIAGFLGTQALILGTAKGFGAEVEDEITNPDFGKVKMGKTRLDFSGGVNSYVRLLGQMYYGQKQSSVSGKDTVFGEGYRPASRGGQLLAFGRQKLAPFPALAADYLDNMTDAVGRKVTPGSIAVKMGTPIPWQDAYESYTKDPEHMWGLIPSTFGASIQTYGAGDINMNPSSSRRRRTPKYGR